MPPKDLFIHLPPVERQAAKILDRLYHLGGECSKRHLARSMSAHKKPLWPFAFDFLVQRGHVRLTDMHSRRHVLVTLMRIPQRLEPRPIIIKSKIKRRRPQTEWFKQNLPKFRQRDGYDDGPDLDALPGPGHNNPPPWPAPEPFEPTRELTINLAEPPNWRNRRS
ncbi:MAG TPA: hypothetical protein VF011_00270 [Terriglobales bacterium]